MAEMTLNNANVFVCSVKNYERQLAMYGHGSLSELTLLKLIYKYACYAPSYACLQRHDAMLSELQRCNKLICVNTLTGDFYPDSIDPFTTDEGATNNPPTIDDVTVNPSNEIVSYDLNVIDDTTTPQYVEIFRFGETHFQTNFADVDGDGPGEIILTSLPGDGKLQYNLVDVIVNQSIPDPTLLVYLKNTNTAINTSFQFRRFDDRLNNPALSLPVTITIGVATSINSEATIGDAAFYVGNQVTTILTTAMFTSQLSPSYSDPDGDEIDAIRIDEISTANQGEFQYNGFAVVVGQIITKADLDAGNFVHVGANVDTLATDTINWSARDAGSLIWVQ